MGKILVAGREVMSAQYAYAVFLGIFLGIASYFFAGTVFVFLVFGLLCYSIRKSSPPEDRRFIATVLIAGFLLRVFFTLLTHAGSYLDGYGGFTSGDDTLYTLRSWALTNRWAGKPEAWLRVIAPTTGHGLNPFTYLIAYFFKVFGFHPVSAKFINCILGTAAGWSTYLLTKLCFDRKAAKISLLIVMFYPSLIRWSTANLTDPAILLLFMLCVYILVEAALRKISLARIAAFGAAIAILCYFINSFYVALLALGTAVALFTRFLDIFRRAGTKCVVAVAIVFFLSAGCWYVVSQKPHVVLPHIFMLEFTQRQIALSDFAGYYLYTGKFLDCANNGIIAVSEFIFVIFKNVAYFMLAPFPWQISSKGQLMAFPQMFIWYCALILSVFGAYKLFLNKPKAAFLLSALLLFGIVIRSLADGNIGAAFRHRDLFTPFFLIFASAAIKDLLGEKKLFARSARADTSGRGT
ncbi:MAG: glycosyltransferase family 39 protein [Candidatus Omnitrophota bacterium]